MPIIDQELDNDFTPEQTPEIPGEEGEIKTEQDKIEEVAAQVDPEMSRLFTFSEARIDLETLNTNWGTERLKTEGRRALRKVAVDIDAERSAVHIKQNETFIPIRVIDTNVKMEMPPYINYLKQSRRIAIFKNRNDPGHPNTQLEERFTDGLTYEGWEKVHFETLDGSLMHGWDTCEVIRDSSKPLGVSIEHVGHDKLLFATDAVDIQFCPRVIREYKVTLIQLQNWVRSFDFNSEQVSKIVDAKKEDKLSSVVSVYKEMFKYHDVVWVAWYSLDSSCDDWLKKPKKLFLGIKHKEVETIQVPQQVPTGQVDMMGSPVMTQVMQPQQQEKWVNSDINLYPYFLLPYSETEEDSIFEYKGRAFLDEFKQEALTCIITAIVNGTTRASEVFCSIDGEDPGGNVKQLQDLEGGTILNRPLKFFHTDYPDNSALDVAKFLNTQNQQETGQVAWAVTNRQDSRKTAEEIRAAQSQTSLLDSVQLTLFSTYIRQVYSFCWKIVQSLALQNLIVFFPRPDPVTGMLKNDEEILSQDYDIRAAGDIDVVQRAEKLNRMLQLWPIVANTPLAPSYLVNLLKVAFPEDANNYEQLLTQLTAKDQLMGQLLQVIMTMMPEILQQIEDPQAKQNFQMLIQQLGQMMSQGQQGQQGQVGPGQQPQANNQQ